jgi:hypothetical protein
MARANRPIRGKINPLDVEPLPFPLELRCRPCGRKGSYSVGRIFLNSDWMKKDEDWLNRSFGFSGYIRCTHCNAGGPWDLTPSSTRALLALSMEAMSSPENARIHLAECRLFDGTVIRWGTEGEAHLKQLIAQDPDNYYLYSRLGNVYVSGDAPELALEPFREAIKRNERDVESHHSIGLILHERKEDDAAVHHLHQVLLHAHHAPEKTSPEMLRNVVRHTLETLAEMHLKSGKTIPFTPSHILPVGVRPVPQPGEEAVLHLTRYDLSKDEDWERMVDLWITGKPSPSRAAPASSPKPHSAPKPSRESDWSSTLLPPASPQVRRNDPCPCGSGKKFKNCCMGS